MEEFTSKQVSEILGITYKQLDYWDRQKLLSPSVSSAKGSGSVRLYSIADVRQLKVVKELKDMGISLQKIKKCLNTLMDFFPDLKYPLIEKQLFTDGKTVYVLTEDPDINIDLLVKKGQLVLFVPLKAWMEELKEIISRFEKERENEDKEHEDFFKWTEDLMKNKGLKPMTPEEIAEITKENRKKRNVINA